MKNMFMALLNVVAAFILTMIIVIINFRRVLPNMQNITTSITPSSVSVWII